MLRACPVLLSVFLSVASVTGGGAATDQWCYELRMLPLPLEWLIGFSRNSVRGNVPLELNRNSDLEFPAAGNTNVVGGKICVL
jgi:hypothetical protein